MDRKRKLEEDYDSQTESENAPSKKFSSKFLFLSQFQFAERYVQLIKTHEKWYPAIHADK